MSSTIIFAFGKDGNVKESFYIHNSFRGAMSVWRELEKRYLPPFVWRAEPQHPTPPNWSRCFSHGDEIEEIWQLFSNKDVSFNDKICLGTTFDNVLVKKENLRTVAAAFMSFTGETSLPEQAKIIETLADDEECIAVGWSQTSVIAENWELYRHDENGELVSYNCLTDTEHWWLFDHEQIKESWNRRSDNA